MTGGAGPLLAAFSAAPSATLDVIIAGPPDIIICAAPKTWVGDSVLGDAEGTIMGDAVGNGDGWSVGAFVGGPTQSSNLYSNL